MADNAHLLGKKVLLFFPFLLFLPPPPFFFFPSLFFPSSRERARVQIVVLLLLLVLFSNSPPSQPPPKQRGKEVLAKDVIDQHLPPFSDIPSLLQQNDHLKTLLETLAEEKEALEKEAVDKRVKSAEENLKKLQEIQAKQGKAVERLKNQRDEYKNMYEKLLEERSSSSLMQRGGEKERGALEGGVSMDMHSSVVKELKETMEVVVKEAKRNHEIEEEKIREVEKRYSEADFEVSFLSYIFFFFFFVV